MGYDLVLEGRAFVNGALANTEIAISDGKIVKVGRSVSGGDKRKSFGGGMIILPGFTDPHVHFRDPGMTHKEDFSTGTMSALFGGVTCVLDMPNTKPPAADVRSLMEKRSAVRGRANTDYGLFAAVTPGCNAALLAPMVCGFKLFMGSTTGNILMNDDAEIASVMGGIAATGKCMSVHAEDDSMILRNPESCCRDHLRNRPAAAEHNAIRRLSAFKNVKINICHNTNAESVRLATEAGFTTEVTMHHLLFEVDRYPGAEYKVNPPIRDAASRDALFKVFAEGKITMFGSDHAPHTISEKSSDFDSAPGGIPGVETTMPMALEMARKGTVPLSMIVRMGAEAPARTFGIHKGCISEGYDGDLAIFDMRNTARIRAEDLHSRAGHTPYAGREAIFPDTVLIRGEIQLSGGEFCGEPIGDDVCGRI